MAQYPTIDDAKRYARWGLRPLWLSPAHAGGRGAGKVPIEQNWRYPEFVHPDHIKGPPGPGCNLGLATGEIPGTNVSIVAVNFDTHPSLVWGEGNLPRPVLRIQSERGELWIYLHPRGGVSIPPGSRLAAINAQVLGDHEQIVVPPSVHTSGIVYRTVGDWFDLGRAGATVFDVSLLADRTSESSPLRSSLGDIPPSRQAYSWLGWYSYRRGMAQTVRNIVEPSLLEHFDAGVAIASTGHRLNRPADIPEALRKRLERSFDEPSKVKAVIVAEMEFSVARLVRRPLIERSLFDVTIESAGRRHTLTSVDGKTLLSYTEIRALAVEGCMLLPPGKIAAATWLESLKEAMAKVEELPMDSQRAVILACRDFLRKHISMLPREKFAETRAEVQAGLTAVQGNFRLHDPEALIITVRRNFKDDRGLTRNDIVVSAEACGMKKLIAQFPDGPCEVWAFPLDDEEGGDPEPDGSPSEQDLFQKEGETHG